LRDSPVDDDAVADAAAARSSTDLMAEGK